MSERRLTVWELHILLAGLALKTNNQVPYGASIAQFIETATGRMVALQTIYDALESLKQRHFVKMSSGQPGTPQRGGRVPMLVDVTPAGEAALRVHLEEIDVMRLHCGKDWAVSNA